MSRTAQYLTILALFIASLGFFSVTIYKGTGSHIGQEGLMLGIFLMIVALVPQLRRSCFPGLHRGRLRRRARGRSDHRRDVLLAAQRPAVHTRPAVIVRAS